MRQLATLLSIFLLVIAVGMLFRLRLTGPLWSAALYMSAQALCTIVAWWGLQAHKTSDHAYLKVFGTVYGVAIVFAIFYALRMAWVHPLFLGSWLAGSALMFTGAIAGVVLWQIHLIYGERAVPPQVTMAVVQAMALCFCGTVTLVALFTELPPAVRFTTWALGGFWAALGLLSYCFALGILRKREVWLHLNDVLPALIAIAAFLWLDWKLGGLQGELVPQPSADHSWGLHTAIVQAGHAFSYVVNFGKELLQ